MTLDKEISNFITEADDYKKTFLGFPINLSYEWNGVIKSGSVYLNNCGDPFYPPSWHNHSKRFEIEVIKYFLKWFKSDFKKGWGYVTSGGTEGNMEGLFIAREKFPDGVLYFSKDTHYSMEKIANILKIKYEIIDSSENGEIDYVMLEDRIKSNLKYPVILSLNCGTTFKGAYDDINKVKAILDKLKVRERYIHVDGALSGMLLPLIDQNQPFTFENGMDSIAVSAHKFLGCPIISGIILTRREYVNMIKSKVEYINSHDTTIIGSRNGQAPLYIYYAIKKYGFNRFRSDALDSIKNAKYLKEKLAEIDYEPILHPNSVTVYFKRPDDSIMEKWQLSGQGKQAHAVVMPHVTKEMIDNLIEDLKK